MASKGRNGAGWLDLAMALLAGGSVAFVIMAMPDEHFGAMVAASGLPAMLEAAQPPLGLTARIAAAGAAGAATLLFVWLLLRMLGRAATPRKRDAELDELDMAPPRLRRVDSHPDAPARRPLFAGTDLGEPEPEPEVAEEAPASSPGPWALDLDQAEDIEPIGEPDRAEQAWSEQPGAPEQLEAEPESEPEPEPEPEEARDEPWMPGEPETSSIPWTPQPQAAPVRAASSEPSLDELVQRLERGSGRRHPRSASSDVNRQLRSALDDLQKLASRGR